MIQTLASGDVFWHDSVLNQDFTVMIVRDDQTYGVCAAGVPRCTATFVPAPEEPALCEGAANLENHEVLILIATFRQISGNSLEPHYEWEILLNDLIDNIEKEVDVSAQILVLPQIVINENEALSLGNCYNASFVLWGIASGASVRNNITLTPRWSLITESSSNVLLNQLQHSSLVEGDSVDYLIYVIMSQILYFNELYDLALPFFEQTLEHIPAGQEREMGSALTYLYIGDIEYRIRNNNDAAVTAFTQAIENSWENFPVVMVYNQRGLAYYEQREFERAIADFDKAIALKPDFADAYYSRANTHFVQNQYEQAVADYEQAIALKPDFAYAYWALGNLYFVLERPNDELTAYHHYLELAGDSADPEIIARVQELEAATPAPSS
jgi:tetratricopeptide (TPR) repeat protein